MLPADQGLGTDDPAASHIDLGLVMQDELLLFQRQADAFHAFVAAPDAAVLCRIEEVQTVLARQLGLVHGLVGLAQQLIGVDVLLRLRVEGDAHAG